MYDTDENRHRNCIHDNLFNCRQPHQHILFNGKEISITVYRFKNAFCKKKLPLIEILSIKSSSCLKH